jgi:phosphoadenosine phosphosulfate reductase
MTEQWDGWLERKHAEVLSLLSHAVLEYGRVALGNSLDAESLVLADIVWSHGSQIDVFAIDTGRLPEETHRYLQRLHDHYGRAVRVVHPQAQEVEQFVLRQGINGFYNSPEARQRCCQVRQNEPFKRAIAGYGAWVSNLRRERAPTGARRDYVEWDASQGLYRVNPLLDWTEADIWRYIRARDLPYNPLYDQKFLRIGCRPCTRAAALAQSRGADQWWWESAQAVAG